jgi:hypothetical protein
VTPFETKMGMLMPGPSVADLETDIGAPAGTITAIHGRRRRFCCPGTEPSV